MAFCFKRREAVPKAVMRLACERIEHALECLTECDGAEAIHCARKDIKKVRAVVRLVRTRIPKKEFRRLTKPLREAASQLAGSRDAYVKAKTLRELARHFRGRLAPRALRHVRAELQKGLEEETKRFGQEKSARVVGRILRRVAKTVKRLNVNGKGWKALGPGVKTAYRQSQRAFQTAQKDSSPENYHEWRKRAKDLWYQMRLLRPIWPEQMDAIVNELHSLSEYLGDDHDLFVLRQDVGKRFTGDGASAREVETLHGLIEQRQRELRAAALALGARFYAEKPAGFCHRLAEYWQTWRREKTPRARFPAATA